MAKKARQNLAEPNPSAVPNRDVLSRLNFMYQAAAALSAAIRSHELSHQPTKQEKAPRLIGTQPRREEAGDGMSIDPSQDWLTLTRAPLSPESSSLPVPSTSQLSPVKPDQVVTKKRSRSGRKRRSSAAECAGRVLVKQMSQVAKKATLRMDPTVKRTLCRGCGQLLVAGWTDRVRVKPSGPHAHVISHTCLACARVRRFPAPPHLPPPPDSTAQALPPESPSIDPSISLSDAQGSGVPGNAAKGAPVSERWEAKQRRRARRAVFFEREGHTTFVGTDKVVRDS